MRTPENDIVQEFRHIRQEYAYNPDIMTKDNPKVARLKEIIETKLSQVDRTIILLYADCGSLRKLGEKMNLSHMTIRREMMRIKDIIIEELKMERKYKVGDKVVVDLYEDDVFDHYEPEYDEEPFEGIVTDISDNGNYEIDNLWYLPEENLFPSLLDAWMHQKEMCSNRMAKFQERLDEINKEINKLKNNDEEV